MPLITLRIRLIRQVRRFPALFKSLRAFKSYVAAVLTGAIPLLLRVVVPKWVPFGPACGWFSAIGSIEKSTRQGDGRIVLLDQGQPQIPEPSIMLRSNLNQHGEQPWPIFWSRHRSARLVGTSLVMLDRQKRVCVEAAYGLTRYEHDPAYCCLNFVRSKKLDGPWTSVVSRWVPSNERTNYAHWLLEALPRLALLEEFPDQTGIIVPHRLMPFQSESLACLGLQARARQTAERSLLIEDYYFSSPPTMIVCHNPYAVSLLRSKLLTHRKSGPTRNTRLYIHRAGQIRINSNEDELIGRFQSWGWDIVDCARLSLAQQIDLFAGAEAVCGGHGAAFANAAWCRSGCKLIEIFGDDYLNGCYEWLCQCVGAEHHFLVFPSDRNGNAIVDVDALERMLRGLKLI